MNILISDDKTPDAIRQIDTLPSSDKQRILARKNQIVAWLNFGKQQEIIKHYEAWAKKVDSLYTQSSADALAYLVDFLERTYGKDQVVSELQSLSTTMQWSKNKFKAFYTKVLDALEKDVQEGKNIHLLSEWRDVTYYLEWIKNERNSIKSASDTNFDNSNINRPWIQCLPDWALIAAEHLCTTDENNVKAYDVKLEKILEESGINPTTGKARADEITQEITAHLQEPGNISWPRDEKAINQAIDPLKDKL